MKADAPGSAGRDMRRWMRRLPPAAIPASYSTSGLVAAWRRLSSPACGANEISRMNSWSQPCSTAAHRENTGTTAIHWLPGIPLTCPRTRLPLGSSRLLDWKTRRKPFHTQFGKPIGCFLVPYVHSGLRKSAPAARRCSLAYVIFIHIRARKPPVSSLAPPASFHLAWNDASEL